MAHGPQSPSAVVSRPQWELVNWVGNSELAPVCAKWLRARPPCFPEQLLLGQRQDGMGLGPGLEPRTATRSAEHTPFVASAAPALCSFAPCHLCAFSWSLPHTVTVAITPLTPHLPPNCRSPRMGQSLVHLGILWTEAGHTSPPEELVK